MKAYGRHRKDHGCCPGHDKYPSESYCNNRSKRAHSRDTKVMHRAERRRQKQNVSKESL